MTIAIPPHLRERWPARFWPKVDKSGECWNWTASIDRHRGYGKFGVAVGRWWPAHRVSYELTHGPIPEGLVVCHRCDNRRCVRPDHLFLGTPADNSRDMAEKKRAMHGVRHYATTLVEADVQRIREMASLGLKQRVIAAEFGITKTAVGAIIRGRSWRYAGGPVYSPALRRTCPTCGQPFDTRVRHQRFCCLRCQKRYNHALEQVVALTPTLERAGVPVEPLAEDADQPTIQGWIDRHRAALRERQAKAPAR